ncbi:M14 family metallopeptidase [Luteimonas terrae]|uniref:Peptidase M14 domain-containing protein n=1 Tax=Luteimonas terrae TaxID=1530191 RepID=A0ABU1XWR3_9GAMM|nr:M14 family metallocarboxypeptidase [Luteimonas terrae]MDR7193197.1 hypothetical protein [Luteimonas terrae]
MQQTTSYPIGTPGQPWGDVERAQWRARQVRQRSHADDVAMRVEASRDRFDIETYGLLDAGGRNYPLLAIRNRDWNPALPIGVVTGGVHGYETSGIEGALEFFEQSAGNYAGRLNLLVVPCVSPWGYEHVQRWNIDAIDPNRSFRAGSPARESAALVALLAPLRGSVLVHVDLHETTDTDESEFRPALAARDGVAFEPGGIPDGFYLVDDSERPQPAFQQAVIAAVERVTHIAPADANSQMIGSPVVAHGVIEYPVETLGLCAGITGARYVTTTEVYPDSPRTTPVECNAAQVASIVAALDYALAHR